ncbi:uncharacterized protein BT62DRAFT_1078619 [Guyanagaster necrorhizus]|uniref:Uncharacterized protein n=1 Tax=Guyanagaster necrorhizus TaxID=856835 RepID=A0A9P7VM58_9AGAR|nr:uncharacterized protein BT62DRAFT_1078619 [Guyanagaster necrorhizus MCA 3950]KAG7443244.1 hypothetical protein BT62DRAFT_1078619 [Guyanagaster necrorhizus MCA 3950]
MVSHPELPTSNRCLWASVVLISGPPVRLLREIPMNDGCRHLRKCKRRKELFQPPHVEDRNCRLHNEHLPPHTDRPVANEIFPRLQARVMCLNEQIGMLIASDPVTLQAFRPPRGIHSSPRVSVSVITLPATERTSGRYPPVAVSASLSAQLNRTSASGHRRSSLTC